ncbi:RNA polymerase sigma-70 factor, ECF subfamily [Amphibacillus marinus]|uniref:RNA polymerase sigma-70 factor, ECF subfamily n=1 Tax=Amphibacillus marinus TaxID=872970 RepID=A0A1H8LN08_9BACI|nr:sigma-70 family RNA polymerase sigma factor [Amphibacillus marinus]SEO06469.1 RNA polymerase sigma-70 factor, ECF subfamily [Amphibacillus marinus]
MTEFEQIYRRYFRAVYWYVYRLTKDQHLAEDITAETFLKALSAIKQFKGECDLRVWLCQIAKNNYLSYLRKHRRFGEFERLSQIEDDVRIEERVVQSYDVEVAKQYITKLKQPYQQVLELRIFQELSFFQIGVRFQKSANWACVTYHRAKNKLKHEMRDYQ